MSSAILLIAHGSREEKSNDDFLRFVREFSQKYRNETVTGAFLELARPLIPDGIESCVRSGADEVFIVPLMFFWGRHVKKDIPQLIEEARARHPGVRFHYAGAIADRPEFLDFLEGRIRFLREAP